MRHHKLLAQVLMLLVPAVGSVCGYAGANQFEPSNSPIYSTPQAKPNIHMVFDDSFSMRDIDIIMPEHAYGFGDPICGAQSSKWTEERKRLGEYDPFSTGRYIPWDDAKAVQGLINGLKKPPRVINCKKVARTEALDYAFRSVMYKYRDKSYLGVSFLWQVNDDGSTKTIEGLVRLPVGDYSGLTDAEFQRVALNPVSKLIKNSPGNTPMYPAVYEAIKMFRGQPVSAQGVNDRYKQFPMMKKISEGGYSYYPYIQHETPLRYRCQQNHLIVMTDGQPNDYKVWGVDLDDKMNTTSISVSDKYINGINQSVNAKKVTAKDIGRITSSTDLRNVRKPILKDGHWVEKEKDDAGKPWNDALSIPMPILTHSVSLFVDPKSKIYSEMTKPTNGMNLGFAEGKGTAEDLMLAFDTIFSTIIRSNSSTVSTNDRTHSDVLEGRPLVTNGQVDMSKVGTIRYDTTYNFRQRFGNIRAMVPYISEYQTVENGKKKDPVISTLELWNTNDTIKANQGRYLTFIHSDKNGLQFSDLRDQEVKQRFSQIFGDKFDESYINWLVNYDQTNHPNQLRTRLFPMGSVTNSDLVLVNKDVLHINAAKDRMSTNLSKELVKFLKYKATYQPVNYLIASDNDGFINFVNAQRGLSTNEKAGARNTAYFPQLLAYRLDDIAKDNRLATLTLEGKTNITDAKVYQKSIGNLYATLGLTSMGSGGKGIVGYRLFASPEKTVNDWAAAPGVSPKPNFAEKDPMNKIIPLFEITNQGPVAYRTKGFEDLGYTYSGFEFFNRLIPNSEGEGQSIAVFGNGFGVDKSILYFIDAYTGEKLHEILLSTNGGGASTPSIIVKNDPNGNGQIIDRIYVGDYSGTIYKVDFHGADFNNATKVKVTALFKAPEHSGHYGQSAISVKPLVTKNKTTGIYNISFGTGLAASHDLDRGTNSQVAHNVYSIVDNNKSNTNATASVNDLASMYKNLQPLLTISDLKVGKVKYKDGANIDYLTEDKHALDIEAPKDTASSGKTENGWAMRLIADGTKSGERTIQNPKYDAVKDSVIFATWGIYERNAGYVEGDLYDPCLADSAFGKLLSFSLKTGSSSSSTKPGIINQGTTGTAEGGITGEGIVSDPEGNSTTDLSEVDKGLIDELEEITGDLDSTYVTEKENPGLHCVGDIFGRPECVEAERPVNKNLRKGRISFQELFSS